MSKLIIFDFKCQTHGLFEHMVEPHVREARCPTCNLLAPRQISAPRIGHLQMALSASASPESISKFDRAHRQQKAKEQKAEREHGEGEYGPRPGAD